MKSTKSNILLLLFNIGISLLILETAHAWMFWNLSVGQKALVYIIIFIIGLIMHGKQKGSDRNSFFVSATFFLFLANVMKTGSTFLGMAEVLLFMLIMWFVMVLPVEQKKKVLDFQTRILALILLVSFVAWTAHFFISLPYTEITRPGFEHLPPAHNYFFFITTDYGLLDYRFHSIFLEPGHLGCIIAFFLMANQYDFRNKYIIVLLIILLFTLSLAGFVIFFLGYFLFVLTNKKNSKVISRLAIGGLIFLSIWLFGTHYNGGNNYVKERIIDRLEYDEGGGAIAGDNRYTEYMDNKFKQTITSENLFLGISIGEYRIFRQTAGNGAGIKIWIIQKGLVGALVLFLGYYFIAKGSKNRRLAIFMLLIYVISSYQRMYFFWAAYLIPYICGSALPLLNNKKDKI